MASAPANRIQQIVTPIERYVPTSPRVAGWRGQGLRFAMGLLVGFGGQYASFMLWVHPTRFTFAWVPGGILLGILILRPRSEWPGWLLGVMSGGVATLIWWNAPPVLAMAAYLPNLVGMVLVALYLQRRVHRIFASVPDFTRYFVTAVLLLPAITGWTSVLVVRVSGLRPGFSPAQLWLTLAPGYAMGYLLIATLLLALSDYRRSDLARPWARAMEAVLIGTGLLLLSIGLWALVPSSSTALPLLLFAPAPLIVLAAMRFGALGAAAALLLVSVPSAWMGVYGGGQFRFDGEQLNAHVVQLWLLAIGFLVHVLAIVSGQYEATRQQLSASHRHARGLAGRLLQSQEEERARIARELHDGVNQQVASLAIAVSSLKRLSPDPLASGLDELHLSMIRLSEDVRRISHNLHPSLLEHVSLGAALEALVQVNASLWEGEIHYESEPGAGRPAMDATVCLYRVAQEAVRNAIQHAGARHIRVQLETEDDACLLVVEDDGIGFDVESIERVGGLGLISMQERVALQGGRMTVVSCPGAGTQIRVEVPCGALP